MSTSVHATNNVTRYSPTRLLTPPPLVDCNTALQAALRLPRTSSNVASWLFPHHETPFADASTIPLALFDNSIAMVSESRFVPFDAAQAPFQDRSFSLLTPTETSGNVTLGFSFHVGLPAAESLLPIRDVLRSKFALLGRFAFDAASEQLLFFLPDFTDNTSHLASYMRLPNGRHVQFLSLPKQHFNSQQLPSFAHGVTYMYQRAANPKLQPCRPTRQDCCSQDENASMVSANGERHSIPQGKDSWKPGKETSSLSRAPLQTTSSTHPADVSSTPVSHQSFHSSVGGLDLRSLRRSLDKILASTSGEFESCALTRDFPCTPELSSPIVLGFFTSLTRKGNSIERKLLQQFAARTYYATALYVSNDMRLEVRADDDEEFDYRG